MSKYQQCNHEIWRDDTIINNIINERSHKYDPSQKKELTKRLKKRAQELRIQNLKKEAK